MQMKRHDKKSLRSLPRVNLRPLLFCAIGLVFGVFLYIRIRFGGLSPSDFLILGTLLVFALVPLSLKRIGLLALAVFLFMGVGVAGAHLYTKAYTSDMGEGNYVVVGTVSEFSVKNGYASVLLTGVRLDGKKVGGKLTARLPSEDVRPGDVVTFTSKVWRGGLPPQDEYDYAENIRYGAAPSEYVRTGASKNLLLRLNGRIYDVLHANMEPEEADVAYALLTGNSSMMDEGLLSAVRAGGIAHIFAVSGLHIGILYAAVNLAFRFLKKYSFLPAIALSVCYCALCGFSVSSVRAVIMCAVLGTWSFFGRKYDLLNSLCFASLVILLIRPAQWLSAGFRLSFGACLGLVLLSGTFSRVLRRIHLPNFLAQALSATLAVQIFTFPILYETFGYFSLWGLLLNPILVPLVPVLFLTLVLCTAFSLIIPPAAAFLMQFPAGLIFLFLLLFTFFDFSAVLTGFSLGAGGVVFTMGTILLSERVRMRALLRGITALVLAVLFSLCIFVENAVLYGCKITVYETRDGEAALIRTAQNAVLVIDAEISLAACRTFLRTTYGKKLDGVIILSEEEERAVNVAAFLDAKAIYAKEEADMGMGETVFHFGESFSVGEMEFRYFGMGKLVLYAEELVVEFSFDEPPALASNLFVGMGSGGLNYFLKSGIIKKL